MADFNEIQSRVFRDMSEGVMVIGDDGKIIMTNPRLGTIIEKSDSEMINSHFAELFFDDENNDEFNQAIMDAVYEKDKVHSNTVRFKASSGTKYLNVISSGMHDDNKLTIGVIVVISDVTDIVETKVRNQYIRNVIGKYLSDEVANEVLNSPEGISLGGKKENITIMLSDLRGFTALCEQIEPSVLMEMANYYFGVMGKIIKENRGTVIEYVGDGILAVFGAPISYEKHAENAVIAALKMQLAMEDVNKWNREHGYPELMMGIGINTGEAVVGNMGSEYTMKYNVLGSSVNLCGRIESYTTGGQIFISTDTYNSIDEELEIDEVLHIAPKGVKGEIDIYSVIGIKGVNNIVYRKTTEELVEVTANNWIKFQKLDGKHLLDETFDAKIISKSSKQYLINTDKVLQKLDNVILRLGEDLEDRDVYCKVLEVDEGNYLLQITG